MSLFDNITFVHFWSFEIDSLADHADQGRFCTSHNAVIHQWSLRIFRQDVSVREDIVYDGAGCDVQLCLEPFWNDLLRPRIVSRCEFKVLVKNESTDEVLFAFPPYVASSLDEFPFFAVSKNSPLGLELTRIFNDFAYRGNICEITTTLVQPLASFDIPACLTAAAPLPNQLNFLFGRILDESRHDLTIVTRGGIPFRVSREGLFLCSDYFRPFISLTENQMIEVVEDEFSLYCVKTVIMFMLTGTFCAPPSLNPQLVQEITHCADKFRAIGRWKLMCAVEKMACTQMTEIQDDVDAVVLWFLAAIESDLEQLQNSASALLVTKHYSQLVMDYSSAATSSELEPTREKLHAAAGFGGQTHYSRLMQLKSGLLNVRAIMNMKSDN